MKILASLLLTTLFAVSPKPHLQTPIESVAREMLRNFVTGRFDLATQDFNEALRPVVTPQLLSDVKAQLDRDLGAFYLVKEAHPGIKGEFRSIELLARFEKGSVNVDVIFDAFDRIQTVYFNPVLPPPVDPTLEALARQLLTNFTTGHYDEAVKPFNAEMAAQLTPASMAGLADNIGRIFGTFQSVTQVQQRVDKRLTIIDLILSYTNGPVAFRVAFDAQNRVAALTISPFKKE
ncbi:MAG TPA: DUF3887 domain-containing protein [Thermoanaerobaculia bacterium]